MIVDVESSQPVLGFLDDLFDVFGRDPDLWLPEPLRHVGPRRWRFELHVRPAHHDVVAEIGGTWSTASRHSRSLHWWAIADPHELGTASKMYPEFDGQVALVQSDGVNHVEVKGHYEPPAGIVGAALDVAGLHKVAEATMAWLTRAIAQRLEMALVDE